MTTEPRRVASGWFHRGFRGLDVSPVPRSEPVATTEPSPTDQAGPAEAPMALGGAQRRLALLEAMRPRQWTKNLLVFVAPGAAGVLTRFGPLTRVLEVFVAFCLVASGTYLINDLVDRPVDRRHPSKSRRPIATGAVTVPAALTAAAALVATGLGIAAAAGWRPTVVLLVYSAITLGYSARLKHVAVLDLGCVAAGFVLRAIAGGVAAGVPISRWFLIVAGAGSLFMVAGKRQAELLQLGSSGPITRPTLAEYTVPYLRFVGGVSASVAIAAYSMWAYEGALLDINPVAAQLSVVPFVLGLLRYALVVELGHGGAPEDVVLGDRPLQLIGLSWLVVFAVGVQLGR